MIMSHLQVRKLSCSDALDHLNLIFAQDHLHKFRDNDEHESVFTCCRVSMHQGARVM